MGLRRLDNCLATVKPDLAREWRPSNNEWQLTPFNVTWGASQRVWWLCKTTRVHVWSVNSRSSKNSQCPYCYGHIKWIESHIAGHDDWKLEYDAWYEMMESERRGRYL